MSEETSAEFHREGDITFTDSEETTAEDTAAESQSEEGQEEDTQSDGGENSQTQEETPFHEHPRWTEREKNWTDRFNDQERRHQEDLKAIREEFGTARKDNAEATQIPAWFGGDQAQWNAYRADRDAELTAIEERATERARKDFESRATNEEQKVKEATEFMQSEIAAIQADKTLNPTGEKIDAEKLFKVVYENQLVDAQGRWNYKAAYRILRAETKPAAAPATRARKEVAASTTSESRTEAPTKKDYMTSEDFKHDRPW